MRALLPSVKRRKTARSAVAGKTTIAGVEAAPQRKRYSHREQTLQQHLTLILRLALPAEVWWTYFPAGGGGARRGGFLKSCGLRPGVPDMMICAPNQPPIWFELKDGKRGRVSEEQKACHLHLRAIGHSVEVVRSIDEAMAALDRHGIAHRVVYNRAARPEMANTAPQPEAAE